MRILITGASGLLGRRLYDMTSKIHECVGTCHGKNDDDFYTIDIRNRESVEDIFHKTRPDAVVHTAGSTDPDYCEKFQNEARQININGTRIIAEMSKRFGSKIVYISSDYIFDGKDNPYRENNETNPINFYGFTKLEGEKIVRGLENHVIVRPTILFGNDERSKESFV